MQLDAVLYGRNLYRGDVCRTARLVGTRKCSDVHAIMKDLPPSAAAAPSSPPLGPARRVGSKRKPAAPQRRKNASQVIFGCSWSLPFAVKEATDIPVIASPLKRDWFGVETSMQACWRVHLITQKLRGAGAVTAGGQQAGKARHDQALAPVHPMHLHGPLQC